MIAVIKTDAQYREIMARLDALVETDPAPDTDEGRELEVLALILRDYERNAFPLAPPNPLAALRLRMDQLGLAPKDLVPFLGSRSKVSEVMASKRPLSLTMIRELHRGLGIPLESLVSEQPDDNSVDAIEWDRFPLREMIRRGWIEIQGLRSAQRISFESARETMERFFKPVGGPTVATGVLHKTDSVRTARSSDRYSLAAWAGRVRRCADKVNPPREFRADEWGPERLRELRSLSRYDVGPRLAIQFLSDSGIVVVIERHLNRTRLDGAAMLRRDGTPVIGLTLRHDRLDNFWFTVFHELMHVLLHLRAASVPIGAPSCYFDDLDISTHETSDLERQADTGAREALLSKSEWEQSAARFVVAPVTVSQLATQVGVGDAIVAGRVRHERRNYRLLSSMVGAGKVRSSFPDVDWSN
jgi:HTH-type transcriptional regulator/antitoxin HigA